MSEIKSLWDGWEKQCYGKITDENGAQCAIGYILEMSGSKEYVKLRERVARYLDAHYDIPYGTYDEYGNTLTKDAPGTVLIYANNVLKLTPEQFREIDRLTQIEEAVKPLVDSVPELVAQ